MNLILNDVEDVIAEHFGLGGVECDMTFYRDRVNPGHNGVFSRDTGSEFGTIHIVTLDKYLAQNRIAAKDVKYIWIDTEGFEAQVLLGAQKLLMKNPALIFMEFNPQFWQRSGYYERLMQLLTRFYEGYVWTPEVRGTEFTVHPIREL